MAVPATAATVPADHRIALAAACLADFCIASLGRSRRRSAGEIRLSLDDF
jgi:hypothetical protein